ncbi:hypothetical protein D3C80_985630 [compost metagenome]
MLAQPRQKALTLRSENARNMAAVAGRAITVASVEACLALFAVPSIMAEPWGVEVHFTLDYPDPHGLHRQARCGNPAPVEIQRVHEAVGGPFVRLVDGPGAAPIALLPALGGGLFDNHSIHADFTAHAQDHRIALHQVIYRQAQLVDIQRRYGTDNLGAVFAGDAPGLAEAVVFFFDQQADQIDIGDQAIHVLRHFIGPCGDHMTALAAQPYRVAGAAAIGQPERGTALGLSRQFQR